MFLAQSRAIPQTVPPRISIGHELQNQFRSAAYKIEQPFVQIFAEGYSISSDDGREKYQAKRPRHVVHSFLATFIAVIGSIATFSAVLMGFIILFGSRFKDETTSPVPLILLFLGVGMALGFLTLIMLAKILGPVRRATVTDGTGKRVMLIEPVSRFHIFRTEFAIRDDRGLLLAKFRKSFWQSFFQAHWRATDRNGKYLFSAIEDNLLMSLLRRYFYLARFIPMHFYFSKGGGKPFGEFRRGVSFRDKYKLRYNSSTAEGFLMVATSILLDTGESR